MYYNMNYCCIEPHNNIFFNKLIRDIHKNKIFRPLFDKQPNHMTPRHSYYNITHALTKIKYKFDKFIITTTNNRC